MRILSHYVHQEIMQRFLWLTGLLFCIYLSSKFIDILEAVSVGTIPSVFIFKLLWLKAFSVLPKLLPVTLFFAVILTYSRLVSDNELLIMRTAGINCLQHIRVLAALLLPIAFFMIWLAFFASPWAATLFGELKVQAQKEAKITGFTAGRFKTFKYDGKEWVFYANAVSDDQTVMGEVFMQSKGDQGVVVLTAESAKFKQDKALNRYIHFYYGQIHNGNSDGLDYTVTSFEEYAILLNTGVSLLNMTPQLKSAAIPSAVLFGSDLNKHKIELQWRISTVLSCVLLPFLAMLLCQLPIAKRRFLLIFVAVLVFSVYGNLLSLAKSLAEQGAVPLYAGLGFVHVLCIMSMCMLYYFPQIQSFLKK